MKKISKSVYLLIFLAVASLVVVLNVGNAVSAISTNSMSDKMQSTATFAGGCFWCMEKPFEQIDGVSSVISGYIGGHVTNPTYRQVVSGRTGHTEAVQIQFDPAKVSYKTLLEVFWRQIDPTDAGGSFVDRGTQYRSGIFYHDEGQQRLAQASKKALGLSQLYAKPIVTEVTAASTFYKAEDYHQDYYKRNPLRYKFYRYNSGRDQFLAKVAAREATQQQKTSSDMASNSMSVDTQEVFIKPNDAKLKQQLTRLQYDVTQNEGTERPFKNEFWDNKKEGIYVDIVSNEALFSSTDKFVSGTGWPSFTKPISLNALIEKEDRGFFSTRVEVRSKLADSHLGHVFDDGPAPTKLRYCINSASMKFIPKEALAESGFARYAQLFPK